MTKSDKLKDAILAEYKSIREFSKVVGIPNSTIVSALEKDIGGMAVDKIIKICDTLNLDIKTLEKKTDLAKIKLSQNETQILTVYRKLNSTGKQEALKRIQELTRLKEYIENTGAEIIPLISKPYYPMPVSAGKGLDIQNAFAEFREISDTNLNRKADFLVRVSGDSMEPKYHDGDTVLVISQTAVDVGDIGVFVLNGDAYIKKFGDGELISLNESYQPIQILETDSLYCRGKVIGKL